MKNLTTPYLNTHLPLLIVVSGSPGSGKTSFATQLAQELKLLHIERDRFFESLEHAAGGQSIDRPQTGIPLFYKTVSSLLKDGVSLVIDCTLYRGMSEDDLLELGKLSDMVNIHCRADDSDHRFYEREVRRADGKAPYWLDGHMVHLKKIKNLVEHPLDISWDIIEVATTQSYYPSILEIASLLRDRQAIRR